MHFSFQGSHVPPFSAVACDLSMPHSFFHVASVLACLDCMGVYQGYMFCSVVAVLSNFACETMHGNSVQFNLSLYVWLPHSWVWLMNASSL
jgi:hypothetical protein